MIAMLLLAATLHAAGPAARADAPDAGATITERAGYSLPLDAVVTDQDGRAFRLGHLLHGGERPTLLILAYYRCRMLCGVVQEQVARALRSVPPGPDLDYRVLTISIDPRDTPADAAKKRDAAFATLGARDVDWTFTVGKEEDLRRVSDAVGFEYRYDERTDQYAHAAVAFAITPDGRISRYLYGPEFDSKELREALEKARDGGTDEASNILQRAVVRCFHYVPALREHAALVANFLRGGAVLIMLALVAAVFFASRRVLRHAEGRP